MRRDQADEGVEIVVCRTTQYTGPGALCLKEEMMEYPPAESDIDFDRSHCGPLVAGFVVCMLTVACLACAQIQKDEAPVPVASQQPPPPWAYPTQPAVTLPPDDGVPRRVPESTAAFTLTQIRDLYVAPDWHPGDHPPLPGVVGRGRKPDMFACGYCHYPNGQGRPENSSLAGLSAGYIAQQIADYKNGLRKSSEPAMTPPVFMLAQAKSATEAEVKISAEYFASLKYKPWIKVVETDTVPKTHVAGFMLVPLEGGGTDPIGQRIIEIAEDRSKFWIHRVRAGRQHQEGRGAGHHRRHGQDGPVWGLPWSGPERRRRRAAAGWPLTELYRAPAVRLQKRRPRRAVKRADEGERRQADR